MGNTLQQPDVTGLSLRSDLKEAESRGMSIGRNLAICEVLDYARGLKLKYAIFGRPDNGQVDRAIGEIETKLEAMIEAIKHE